MTTLYHGTKNDFSKFNTDVVFFTTNINMAKSYGKRIIEKNIEISNIVEVDAKGDNWRGFFLSESFATEFYQHMVKSNLVYYTMEELTKMRFSTNSVVTMAKELGKDFVKISNVEDYGSEVENMIPSDVYVALKTDLIN